MSQKGKSIQTLIAFAFYVFLPPITVSSVINSVKIIRITSVRIILLSLHFNKTYI